MGPWAAQAHVFYKDVAKSEKVWTIRDARGYPAPLNREGRRAQPFWSSLSRVKLIIENVPAYGECQPVEISWKEFRDKWLPDLHNNGMLVGMNWSGKTAKGYDMDPQRVRKNVESCMGKNIFSAGDTFLK